jgi:glutamate/tyrosine decarboxylase-like PLP-dependent enzyme
MPSDFDLLRLAAERAIEFAATIDERDATPTPAAIAELAVFDEPLPELGRDAADTIELLAAIGGPAAMGSAGPNYFGFVNGATLPAALAASFIADAWDQNAALPVMSPIAAKLYDVSRVWLLDLLGLEPTTDVVYVTGATVANAACLAAARDALLADRGWHAPSRGLFGAPAVQVVVGERAHSTLRKSLGVIGLGSERVVTVASDDQGRMLAGDLPDLDQADGPIVVCAQAGEVNTGAFDPFDDIADWAVERGAWLHIDAAFGLWALADQSRGELTSGMTRADSIATDGHKWLNVTYDCGIAFVRRDGALRRTFASLAGYLPPDNGFESMHHTPQSSQRARQIEVWAALRTLGRDGVADLVRLACDCAELIADRLRSHDGFEILNDVVLNQVLVRFRDGAATAVLIDAVQRDGRIWCGPTQWRGETAMRVSVSSWRTTLDDAARAADVIATCAARV